MIAKMYQPQITSGQARKGLRIGHPELSVECPLCHSAAGRRCFMKPGLLGITHAVRQLTYESKLLERYSSPAARDVRITNSVR